jgi:flavin-dependent dehydrogenase
VWTTPDTRRLQSSDHSGFLQIEAVEDGWWYFGTLPNDEVVAVLMTDADLVRTEQTARPPWSPWWMSRAAQVPRLWSLLAATSGPLDYAAHSAGSSCLAESAGDGWLAVGDASIAFDPLSSRGIVQALESGMRAADTIVAVLAGDSTALVRFAPSVCLAFTSYSHDRTDIYSGVQRWKERPFWSRRLHVVDQDGLWR